MNTPATPSVTNEEPQKVEWINNIPYCSSLCVYLEDEGVHGYCHKLKRDLGFYDWFVAECVDELIGI